jgi:hypothetical protein
LSPAAAVKLTEQCFEFHRKKKFIIGQVAMSIPGACITKLFTAAIKFHAVKS